MNNHAEGGIPDQKGRRNDVRGRARSVVNAERQYAGCSRRHIRQVSPLRAAGVQSGKGKQQQDPQP